MFECGANGTVAVALGKRRCATNQRLRMRATQFLPYRNKRSRTVFTPLHPHREIVGAAATEDEAST